MVSYIKIYYDKKLYLLTYWIVKYGKVRTKTVKKTARFLLEKYFFSLSLDFQINKKFCDEVALIPSKNLRNKIAGFVTHLIKRLSRGTIQGVSIKLQENQRDQKNEQKELFNLLQNLEFLKVDDCTAAMLHSLLQEKQ